MKYEAMKTAIRNTITGFFANGKVYYAETKMGKQNVPYVTLKFRNLHKGLFPIDCGVNDTINDVERDYQMSVDLDINLYTEGKKVGNHYENTAMGDMMDLVEYLDSDVVEDSLSSQNISIQLADGTLNDLSELIDVQYRYRAFCTYRVYFTDEVYGKYGQKGKTLPNSSGGGVASQASTTAEYFTTVVVEEEE